MPKPESYPQVGFRPAFPMQERILAFGPPKVGKTRGVLDIMKRIRMTKGDAKLYVIESDLGSTARMLNPAGSFHGLVDMVEINQVENWDEWVEALDHVKNYARPQDWCLVDHITDAWEAVQEDFTEKIHGTQGENYFMARRVAYEKQRAALIRAGRQEDVKGQSKGVDGPDWEIIKKRYNSWFNRLYGRLRCNLFACAQVRDIRKEHHKDDEATMRVYGSLGCVPKGEKTLGHRFDTILFFWKEPGDEGKDVFKVQTVGDRERPNLVEADLKAGFSSVYLRDVAGWVMR